MKRVLLVILLVFVAAVGFIYFYYFAGHKRRDKGPKPVPLAVSKHSEPFNNSVSAVMNAYYKLSEAFVNWDSVSVAQMAGDLKLALDSFRVDELQKDTIIYLTALDPLTNAKTEVDNIIGRPGLAAKRASLNTLSDNIRNLLVTVRYDREKIYWQECPMAFGEEHPGNWLSKAVEVRNPYLGNKHPDYKDNMLTCGGPKDTINFVVADTTHH